MYLSLLSPLQVAESRRLIDAVLQVQPRVADSQSASGASHDDVVCELAAKILRELPEPLDKA
eukprot:scaffold37579_cov27-Prasinocladus_malaysianus.AAC.1